MFKNFFTMLLTAVMGGSGCLPFMPIISKDTPKQESYYCDTSYSGYGTQPESHTETIEYDSYTLTLANVDILCPNYSAVYGTNACAPTAGSVITTYYDYYFPNLLPDYEPTYIYDNTLYWKTQNATVSDMQEELYNLMGTNTIEPGTSVSQFKSGITSYFNTAGYNVSFNNVSSSITTANVTNWFNQEKPIVLFLTSYDYYPAVNFVVNDTQTTMLGLRKNVGHVVVAYAYFEYTYYNDNEAFQTDKWLYVVFGNSSIGFLKMDNTSYIQEAYTFNVS